MANLDVCWDLSVSTGPQGDNPSAFSIAEAKFEPIRVGNFVGSVAEGGSANCEVLTLCAHGNGTHTECVGHITSEKVALGDVLKQFWFDAQVVSVNISGAGFERLGFDDSGFEDAGSEAAGFEGAGFEAVGSEAAGFEAAGFEGAGFEDSGLPGLGLPGLGFVGLADVKAWSLMGTSALVVRSLPNPVSKKHAVWSGNNAPYFEPEALAYLRDQGIQHLLTDFPSVDREEDEGRLSAHHEWWGVAQRVTQGVTERVTERVPQRVTGGNVLGEPQQRMPGGNVLGVSPAHPRFSATITELIYVPEAVADGLYLLNLQVPNLRTDAVPSRPVLYACSEVG